MRLPAIPVAPLNRAAFAPFGDVVEVADADRIAINQGFAERLNDLAYVDVSAGNGEPNVSLFVCKPRPTPIIIEVMERHPLGSQMFIPLRDQPWLVLACTDPNDGSTYRAFRASGSQAVNYARNIWHHPLLALADDSLFVVVDRKGPGNNLEEIWLSEPKQVAPL